MFKKIFKGLLYILVIVIAILLPLLSGQHPIITGIYNFISKANKDYYQVVLSALAIFTTFLIFSSQNEKERNIRYEDEEKRNEREEKEYQANRENRFASARPYFIVEKNNANSKAKINIFMENDVPLENILVCEKKISDKEDEVNPQIIGTKNSGDTIYEFSLGEIEMIVVKCTTYFDEDIYFQYYTGDLTVHYRMIQNAEDLDYSKSLKRTYLSDFFIEQNEKNEEKNENTEIYKQNIYSLSWEKIAKKRFSQYRSQILKSIVENRIFTENKNLKIIAVIEKDRIGEILSGSINYLRAYKKDFSNELIIELLEVIKEFINNKWYTTCGTLSGAQKDYFIGNLTDPIFRKKYSLIFDKSVDAEIMMNYTEDLILFVKKGGFNDFLFRNLEVYLDESVSMATGRIGYDTEINLVYNDIRSKIKQILSKTL